MRTINVYAHNKCACVCERVSVCILSMCVWMRVSTKRAENICAWIFFQNVKFSLHLKTIACGPLCAGWQTAEAAGSSGLATTMTPTLAYIHTHTHIYASAAKHAHVCMHVCVCMLICEMYVWLSARALCYCCCCCYCYCMFSFSSTPPPPPSTKNKNKASSQTKSRHQRH